MKIWFSSMQSTLLIAWASDISVSKRSLKKNVSTKKNLPGFQITENFEDFPNLFFAHF